jgi:carboxyl-terminal processing protease
MIGTLVTAIALSGVLAIGMGNLRSFAGPSYQELALLTNVLHLVQQHYVSEVDTRELIEGALKGMLDVLDPHTSYLSEEFYREVQLDTKGEFEGLGIEITKRDGFVTVVSPIDDTPAARAGIKAKDQIVAVCPDTTEESCLSTQEMNLLEAVNHMRGPRGTSIMIQIMREGWTAPKPFVIKRASIHIPSVTVKTIEPGLPYVRLSQFQERTAESLAEELRAVAKENGGQLDGLVLDLRDNPGGLLDQAVKVADLFIDDGLIVFSEGRGGENRMEWRAKPGGVLGTFPVVVLVNSGSASASEIVAGAIQDHHRGLLLGTSTFGKGSVQTIIPLEDGSGLRLTTALYYLPSGRSIQETGVAPDVSVEQFTEAELEALAKEGPRAIGEVDLEGHLTTERSATSAAADPFKEQLARDRQLAHAVDLLKSWNIFSTLPSGSGPS